MKVKIIKAPAGLGKTRMVLDLITATMYGKIEYYVPTHDLADELVDILNGLPCPPHFDVIRGRDQPYNAQERMCKRHVLATQLSDKGYPIYPVLCKHRSRRDRADVKYCEHYDKCPYIQQFDSTAQVYIYVHASLSLERGALEGCVPGLAIIDESFFKTCTEPFSVPLVDLLSPKLGADTRQVCKAVVDALLSGKPLLRTLREQSLDGVIRRAIDENKREVPPFSPWWNDKMQAKAVAHLPMRPRIRELLECLTAEIATPRDESHALTFDSRKQAVQIHRRTPITRFADSKDPADIVILDANADRGILEQWFPEAEFEEITAPRKAFVTQCKSVRGSTTSLVPEKNENAASRAASERRLKDLQCLIDRKSSGGKRVLVVGPQAVTGNPNAGKVPLIQCPNNGALAHFNDIRGSDIWKDFDVAIIVGRNQPPIEAVEAHARAIWYDSPEPLMFAEDWVIEVRGYRVRGGMPPTGADVHVHPDRRIQSVLEQLRECEIVQAVDRLRLIHATSPKEVILLSSIPVDIEVDRLLSWEEITLGTRLERAWAKRNGVLPLEPTWLAETYPDLWSTAAAAKQDVALAVQKDGFSNSIYISNSILLTYDYRQGGQSRPSHAISTLSVHEAQRELTLLLGVPLIVREGIGQKGNTEYRGAMGGVDTEPLAAAGTGHSD